MKYMMFVITDSDRDTESDESDVNVWVDELDSTGKRIIGEVLQAPTESRVVRVRDGKRYVTDGPFAETKEWICGFDILECDSIDEAVEVVEDLRAGRCDVSAAVAALRVLAAGSGS